MFSVSDGLTQEKDLHLESWSYQYAEELLDGPVISMILTEQESKTDCVLGTSFGFDGNRVWVDKGARGWFKVKYAVDESSTVEVVPGTLHITLCTVVAGIKIS